MSQMTTDELNAHVDSVMMNFKGDIVDLTHAVGALNVGRIYGWRVLRIIVSSPSYTKYQRILGVQFKDVLPESTDYSTKSAGYNLVVSLGNFWDVVKGIASIDKKEKTSIV